MGSRDINGKALFIYYCKKPSYCLLPKSSHVLYLGFHCRQSTIESGLCPSLYIGKWYPKDS